MEGSSSEQEGVMQRFYRTPGLHPSQQDALRRKLYASFHSSSSSSATGAKEEGREQLLLRLVTEHCYNVQWLPGRGTGAPKEQSLLRWLLCETFEPQNFSSDASFLLDVESSSSSSSSFKYTFELGPRLNFATAWSTNALSICRACGVDSIYRVERSRRIHLELSRPFESEEAQKRFLDSIHDRMTECVYEEPIPTFHAHVEPEKWHEVPVMEEGRAALERINTEMGLAFDDWDLDYYTSVFKDQLKRNPTTVECFDISQSNSEHSRHWFFKGRYSGSLSAFSAFSSPSHFIAQTDYILHRNMRTIHKRMVIDGEEIKDSLFDLVMQTLHANKTNSVIAFRDNSSAIRGYPVRVLTPSAPGKPSGMIVNEADYNLTLTAETHNFPTGVAPFPGAETGTGGRIRDGHATGRGSLVVAGTVGYSVGNLHIPGYDLPWEQGESKTWAYSKRLASPLQVEIEASNGASDYGNKFGEPVITGFTRSFGMRVPCASSNEELSYERREYVKPIMFSGGIGQMDAAHTEKGRPEAGMTVVKLGGPAYRIGVGGGAASSMAVQGTNTEELDFQAVQRGDAEMEQKVNRVIRACIELGGKNPIVSIHDQGAGGNGNVLKEIVEPAGAVIELRNILLGDQTLSVLEIWGAEYQEADALLIRSEDEPLFASICRREGAPFAFVGTVTGDGRVRLHDAKDDSNPFDLDLDLVLAKMPRKVFKSERAKAPRLPLSLGKVDPSLNFSASSSASLMSVLERVLRLLNVGSKRFLTNKVDRSVTGLIAQQQCVGPFHTPLADYALIAQSHFGLTGGATSIGEQPIKGLLDPSAMARMSVGEMLTNIVWVKVSGLDHIKCSGNWMWAAKLPNEGAAIYDACKAMRDVMIELGVSIDGGKDSLSMAAKVGEETVKAPGTLVVSGYCSCPDITKRVTPDLKFSTSGSSDEEEKGSYLLFLDLSNGKNRIGGSALAQVYNQLGDDVPDLEDVTYFKSAWNAVQQLVDKGMILAGHDRSDGGLLVTLLEMAFSGNVGIELQFDLGEKNEDEEKRLLYPLFAEELGLVLEVDKEKIEQVSHMLTQQNIRFLTVGRTLKDEKVVRLMTDDGEQVLLEQSLHRLRDIWEETSFQLERLQTNPECVESEQRVLSQRPGPKYHLSFDGALPLEDDDFSPSAAQKTTDRPKVAILREEGSNGDREMAAAFHLAGFETWDVKMSDIIEENVDLSQFRGIAFVGGFSYADVLDSGKGWAGVIKFHDKVLQQFKQFYERPDTFSLGVCNGCQLMAMLGLIPYPSTFFSQSNTTEQEQQPRFITNKSARFESRFPTVRILDSPAIMLKGMSGSSLGIWSAHGEGRAFFPQPKVLERVLAENLAPIRYVDDEGEPTEVYPFNPPGSPMGIAALCSPDGRHLAMMPHPERTVLEWQWAWMPNEWQHREKKEQKGSPLPSPWLRMFQNARVWCQETASSS
ncbi:phosphoribosylformylglycinamidine synthase [Balamuthia mandrillaris]